MKIAVIYHSQSGHTEIFAQALTAALIQAGHTVESAKLDTAKPVKMISVREHQEISLSNMPALDSFDVILWGGPVWAFGPSPVIIAAIRAQSSLAGKRVIPFATMGSPLKCMGGNAALKYMSRELAITGAKVLPGQVCSHMFINLDWETEQATAKILASLN